MQSSYRMDNRTSKQFMEDIELSSKIERLIVERYARYVKRVYGVEIVVTDNGCDNSGGYLPDCKVSTKADFLINGKPYEIKHFKPMLRELPLKADSLQSYIDQGAQILLVNGYASKHPQFTLIQPHHIQRIVDTCTTVPHKPWGGKPVYMMLKKDFNWNNLDD